MILPVCVCVCEGVGESVYARIREGERESEGGGGNMRVCVCVCVCMCACVCMRMCMCAPARKRACVFAWLFNTVDGKFGRNYTIKAKILTHSVKQSANCFPSVCDATSIPCMRVYLFVGWLAKNIVCREKRPVQYNRT